MRPIEVRFDKNINNLTLVREADTRRQWEYVTVTMLGAVFVLGFLFYGWQRYQFTQYGYSLENAQIKKVQLVEKGNKLRLLRAQLENGTRIGSLAKGMGMVEAMPGQTVHVDLENKGNSQPQLSANK